MSGVSFTDVRKEYGGSIVAVDDFDLEIEDGEFVSIVGPSGSGKSTLLRMVAGLEEITDGTIEISDRVVNGVDPQNRGVAMVFQNYALYPHMNVRKNMSYGLKLTTDMSDDQIDRRVEEAAEMMGIENLLDKKPGNLSGGQQQRVATGRAIVRDPDAFLMDEPLSNLDAKLKIHMRTELQRIHDDLETTTLYVTHDQEEAMTMSDRIVILANGQCQQVGTPEEVYHEPANEFVAGFIGSPSMNIYDVRLEDRALVNEVIRYELTEETASQIETNRTNDHLRLGIRPEHVEISENPAEGDLTANVDVVEPIGSDYYVYLTMGDLEGTVRITDRWHPDPGEDVGITFDESDIHVFDRETEENLLIERDRDLAAV
ncbi:MULTISPECIES: ABC transporter ATP-binding protein [Halorussus]|uniref:ABC transporter ATP-binding protein n=1 Tax=Halorussus TaxID=1070314 RepID=UPI0020A0EDB4|nr:sn-glycerol-3-phosphate ABC transporter ATP-binding protein UgpC [Halorussus vallis]USZ77369.1 sn-glycerol-3-phosphate ABC transporter ATP-binding protein UgpC [Halorussus vallis]